MVIKIKVAPVGKAPKYNANLLRKVIDEALVEESGKIEGHFDTIVSGFETVSPSFFTSKVKKIGWDREIKVYTASKSKSNYILSIMNFGLGPRDIRPGPGKGPMKFQVGYTAATTPGRIASRRRDKHGTWRTTMHVREHEIRARRFDLAIVKRRKGYFTRLVQGRMNKVTRRLFK